MNQDLSDITLALAAGALAALRPNLSFMPKAQMPLYKAHDALRALIQARYPNAGIDSLNIAPGSQERQQIVDNELRRLGALDDRDVQRAAAVLLAEIAQRKPETVGAVRSPFEH